MEQGAGHDRSALRSRRRGAWTCRDETAQAVNHLPTKLDTSIHSNQPSAAMASTGQAPATAGFDNHRSRRLT